MIVHEFNNRGVHCIGKFMIDDIGPVFDTTNDDDEPAFKLARLQNNYTMFK